MLLKGDVKQTGGITVLCVSVNIFRNNMAECQNLLDTGRVDEVQILKRGKPSYRFLGIGPSAPGKLEPGTFELGKPKG